MEKKEFHRANLPHFQQLGQAYFVTWNLQDAIPPKALKDYTEKLYNIKSSLNFALNSNQTPEQINAIRFEYNILRKKLIKASEDVLHLKNKCIVDLSKTDNTIIVQNALCYWEGKKIKNYAICVMPNHIHWVFQLFEKDKSGNSVWLEDILKSVKQYSANKINFLEHLSGPIWHKESWDTTIRDHRHLYEAIEYTRNNPVVAGLVKNWEDWKGTMIFE